MKKIQGVSKGLGVKITKELCPIHHVPIRSLGKFAVCPVCAEVEITREKSALVKQQLVRSTQGLLTSSRSLPADQDEFEKASFANFMAEPGSAPAVAKDMARHIAGQYLHYSGKWTADDQRKDSQHIAGALKDPNDGFNCLLSGEPGSGKTHLATAMVRGVNEFAKPYQRCLFVSIIRLMAQVKTSWSDVNYWWTESNAERLLKSVDLLVLDDLGTESAMQNGTEARQWVQEFLMRVLEAQHRVIFTTNLSVADLKKTYNPKLVSRVLAGAQGRTIDFSCIEDHRAGQ